MSVSCRHNGQEEPPVEAEEGPFYTNPVIAHNCPDPSIIDNRARDGYFYVYSTENGTNDTPTVVYLPVYRSKDMINWEPVGNAFGGLNRPVWRSDSRLWAPDINYVNGRYVLYYALGCWDDSDRSASGVAVSDHPEGPFTDIGMLVDMETQGVGNSIDPNFFDDGEHKYLFWGSFGAKSGIFAIELSSDGLSIKEGAKKVQIGTNMEGTYIHKRGNWYYAFGSKGSCCSGAESTYHIVVARSKNVLGPYEGPDGKLLTDASFDNTILFGTKLFTGPGHDGEIITDDNGQDWMVYHAYCQTNNYNGRSMVLDKVFWTEDGWPYFNISTPTPSGHGPVFK
jgi:arabinan endo-1,5-alpha-L-arabinosidase